MEGGFGVSWLAGRACAVVFASSVVGRHGEWESGRGASSQGRAEACRRRRLLLTASFLRSWLLVLDWSMATCFGCVDWFGLGVSVAEDGLTRR
jgi:hypothetical protein